MFRNFIAVGLGGAIGAMLRYAVTLLGTAMGWAFGWSTFAVNVVGSFVMGLLVACFGSTSTWILFLTTGMCGGFTTFSTFSVQSVTLLQQGKYGPAALYVFGTLCACLAVAFLGYYLGQKLK